MDELRPTSYRRFTARVKESELNGWLCLLGEHRRALLLHLEEPGGFLPPAHAADRLAERSA